MSKSITAVLLALLAGLVLAGSSTGASAYWRHHHCCGGPVAPSYIYHTVQSVRNVIRYHDVSQVHYVDQPQPIVHVTRVQPIILVQDVTRVHQVTVPVLRPYDVGVVQWLPPRQVVTPSISQTDDCQCDDNQGW